ncbi:MAG: hypothetical protein AAF740_11445 [Bacteroidota bacterium]
MSGMKIGFIISFLVLFVSITQGQTKRDSPYRLTVKPHLLAECTNKLYIPASDCFDTDSLQFECTGCETLKYDADRRILLIKTTYSGYEDVILNARAGSTWFSTDTFEVKPQAREIHIEISRDQYDSLSEEEIALGFPKDTLALADRQPLPKFLKVNVVAKRDIPCINERYKVLNWRFTVARGRKALMASSRYTGDTTVIPEFPETLQDGDKIIFEFSGFIRWNPFLEAWENVQIDAYPKAFVILKKQ